MVQRRYNYGYHHHSQNNSGAVQHHTVIACAGSRGGHQYVTVQLESRLLSSLSSVLKDSFSERGRFCRLEFEKSWFLRWLQRHVAQPPGGQGSAKVRSGRAGRVRVLRRQLGSADRQVPPPGRTAREYDYRENNLLNLIVNVRLGFFVTDKSGLVSRDLRRQVELWDERLF